MTEQRCYYEVQEMKTDSVGGISEARLCDMGQSKSPFGQTSTETSTWLLLSELNLLDPQRGSLPVSL